jgi:hypothetical protein
MSNSNYLRNMNLIDSCKNIEKVYFFIIFSAILFQVPATIFGLHEDLLLHWEEGLRIVSGQIPYNDYFFPWGPISGYVGAFFLLLTGSSIGWSMILLAVIVNVTASLSVAYIVKSTTNNNSLTLIAGVFTSAWYLTHIGGFYVDHNAYLVVLLAGVMYVSKTIDTIKYISIGVLCALAFWVKQTTGTLGGIGLGVAILLAEGFSIFVSRRFVYMVSGYLVTFITILSFILHFADVDKFIEAFYLLPIEYAKVEPNKNLNILWQNMLLPFNINIIDAFKNRHSGLIVFFPLVLLIYMAYYVLIFKQKNWIENKRLRFSIIFFLLTSLLCSPTVGRDITDTVWGLGGVLALVFYIIEKQSNKLKNTKIYFLSLVMFVGMSVLLFVYPKVKAEIEYIDLWDLSPLYPVQVSSMVSPHIDIKSVYKMAEFLHANIKESDRLVVYDDNAKLISTLNSIASYSELLFFDVNITIPRKRDSQLQWQKREIEKLQKLNVNIVISTLNASKRRFRNKTENIMGYSNLDIIKKYLGKKYELVTVIGGIEYLSRRNEP